MRKTILLALVCLLSSSGVAQTPTIDVYVLAGQSNMDGRGLVKDLSAQQRAPIADATIFYRNPPFASKGWTPLIPGYSVPVGFKGTLPSTSFGPEIGFAKALKHSAEFGLIKGSKGNTSLAVDWNPGEKGQSGTQGVCYRELLSTISQALEALRSSGKNPQLRGLLWHQGESDVAVSTDAYARMLRNFISRIRDDLGNATLPVALGEVYDDGSIGRQNIRRAQEEVGSSTARVVFIPVDGLVTLDNGTHFDAASQLSLGQRFAEAWNQTFTSQP